MTDRDLARTDEEITRERGMVEIERLEAEVEQLREELASEAQNRKTPLTDCYFRTDPDGAAGRCL
jgi:hypothetical protein